MSATIAAAARERVRHRQDRLGTHLCVGLDPDPARLPGGWSAGDFCRAIMEATEPYVCAFKPNSAFFEALGLEGWTALAEVMAHGRDLGVPMILDAKRADIGSSAVRYAEAAFGRLGADALTVSPYLGSDAITPFLEYNKDALSFVLCATSNASGAEFQASGGDGGAEPLYLKVARMVDRLNHAYGNVGLVVGATRPETMQAIRQAAPDAAWLVPGVGEQGGDLASVARTAPRDVVFNASRAVLYAGSGEGFARAAAQAAMRMRDAFGPDAR